MDEWPFWMFEENIKIVNEIIDEEEKNRKDESGTLPNTNDLMKNASNMTSNFSNFNFPKF